MIIVFKQYRELHCLIAETYLYPAKRKKKRIYSRRYLRSFGVQTTEVKYEFKKETQAAFVT